MNPVAVELGRLFLDLPDPDALDAALGRLEATVRPEIERTYMMETGEVASHYLWDGVELQSVWSRRTGVRGRVEHVPTKHDVALSQAYATYESTSAIPLDLFQNARINAHATLALGDLFTGRALHNIDMLQHAFADEPEDVRRALTLTLTASSGQMSQMVFAITGRGKTTGAQADRVEVGSWVIGYWRPVQHFEINCWNCYEGRARRLRTALNKAGPIRNDVKLGTAARSVADGHSDAAVVLGDAATAFASLPTACARLVLADPPHTDRVPYLELSGMWNALLGLKPDYVDELIVSNATGREKTLSQYAHDLARVFKSIGRALRTDGHLALFFNSAKEEEWAVLSEVVTANSQLRYRGAVPMQYSAGSVVQDNRAGALKHDLILLFGHADARDAATTPSIREIPGWTEAPIETLCGAYS